MNVWMDGWMGFSKILFWFEIRDLLGWMGRVCNNVLESGFHYFFLS
jgi:hypothetical protein